MQTVYCIPGLGADEKMFQHLDLSFVKPVFIRWLVPLPHDTLSSYALRLQEQFVPEQNPVIIGLSLGGMLAVEMAKANSSARAIIVSSAKTKNEIPYYWRMFRHFPLYKILPHKAVEKASAIQQYFLGASSPQTKERVNEALKKADERFYKWALDAILSWQNNAVPNNITHIHGTNDRLLPFKYVKADISIKNAGHLMIIENAPEISSVLRQIFAESLKKPQKTEKKYP